MNTDQAFDLLRSAGVAEDVCIQMVRRWLREKKINYEGRGSQKTRYIPNDSDEAFELLKDAGVPASIGIPMVRRWLSEGKIQNAGSEKRKNEYIPDDPTPKLIGTLPDQEKMIRQLKAKIKVQDDHIKGMEDLHKNAIKTLIQQREKLNKEIINLEKNKSELQREVQALLKENIELRNQLLKLKEDLYKGSKSEQFEQKISPIGSDYRQKLGLSKKASQKEILTGFKKLLKITHPDQGGNAFAFHYIKTDFDYYRNSLKG